MKRTSCRRRLAIASVLVVTLAACGGGSGGLEVTEAWARTSPAMAGDAARLVANQCGCGRLASIDSQKVAAHFRR